MNWLEKLQVTRSVVVNRPEMAIVFSEGGAGATEEFLTSLRQRFPSLHQDYIEFLRIADGLQVDMCVLFGSGRNQFPSIEQAMDRWNGILDSSDFLPIGEDASGRCFALDRGGAVWRFEHDPPDPEAARRFSSNFSDFLNDVLMGSRFVELFDGYWHHRKSNEWSQHMREQGWL